MFKKFGIVLSAGALGLVATTFGTPALAAEVTLKGASCFPVGSPVSKPWANMINDVNKRGKGDIQIKLVGGAPAIGSPFTLTQKILFENYDLVLLNPLQPSTCRCLRHRHLLRPMLQKCVRLSLPRRPP